MGKIEVYVADPKSIFNNYGVRDFYPRLVVEDKNRNGRIDKGEVQFIDSDQEPREALRALGISTPSLQGLKFSAARRYFTSFQEADEYSEVVRTLQLAKRAGLAVKADDLLLHGMERALLSAESYHQESLNPFESEAARQVHISKREHFLKNALRMGKAAGLNKAETDILERRCFQIRRDNYYHDPLDA